jgi:hypothetical protein
MIFQWIQKFFGRDRKREVKLYPRRFAVQLNIDHPRIIRSEQDQKANKI